MYDRMFTAEEVQRLVQAATAPLLAAQVHLLQVLIGRLLALYLNLARPHHRHRQRTMCLQQALAPDTASELDQLFEEAAKYMDEPSLAPDPAEDLVIEEYVPGSLST